MATKMLIPKTYSKIEKNKAAPTKFAKSQKNQSSPTGTNDQGLHGRANNQSAKKATNVRRHWRANILPNMVVNKWRDRKRPHTHAGKRD